MRIIRRSKTILLPLLALLLLVSGLAGCNTATPTATPADEPNPILTRNEAPEQYRWDLTEFYATRADFDAAVALIKDKYIPELADFKGKLGNAESLLGYFQLLTEASIVSDNLQVYSTLMVDLDQTDTAATEMADIVSGAIAELDSTVSFAEPEILALDETAIRSMMDDPRLAARRYYLQTLLERKEHVLSDKEEHILAALSEVFAAPEEIFSSAQYADFTNPTFTDRDGQEIELDDATYAAIMADPDREYRKAAYEAMMGAYGKMEYTMAANYMTKVKIDTTVAELRHYDSALEAALASEPVPRSIYDNLLEATHGNLGYLHSYYGLHKKALGLDELHSYDMSVPLVEDYGMDIPYDEAVAIVAAALAPLGDEYVADFRNGIEHRWVDVYPDDHKYTGCYEWDSYTSHPYVLLNWEDSLFSVQCLTHEMGHAMNSYYSSETQDYCNAYYTIFTAEVASITNEMLLMDYLIENAASDDEKLYLLLQQIENINQAFYSQVMFSEFEQRVHARAEAGEPLSAEVINNIFLELLHEYRGPDYTVDEIAGLYWDRIPHFYHEFYVYKYATSIAAARQLADNILEGKDGARENYLEFLAAGSSDYPVELLKDAGVDMNSPAPVDNLLAYFGELVDEAGSMLQARRAAD